MEWIFSRSWNERFGAEPVVVLPYGIQFVVARPPATFEEALPLGYEHLALNAYVLDDSYQSARWLAKDLVGAKVWTLTWE